MCQQQTMIFPPFLKKGDKIAIAATARSIQKTDAGFFTAFAKQEGFEVVFADNIGKTHHRFAGNDIERAAAFQKLIDDPTIKAIVCARGGYGTTRILPLLNWNKFLDHPKWICGFSDVTALHGKLNRLGVVSIHSGMLYHPNKLKDEAINEYDFLLYLLTGSENIDILEYIPEGIEYCTIVENSRNGIGEGRLVGGNLSMINNMIGTDYDFIYDGAILLIEDVDEYVYNIDRMIRHLKACGIFERLNGLIVGDFTNMKDDKPPFGESTTEIILDAVKEYTYPVYFNELIGHLSFIEPYILGAKHRLTIEEITIDEKQPKVECFVGK